MTAAEMRSGSDSVAELLASHRESLEAAAAGDSPTLPFGLAQLDAITGGIEGTLAVASPPGGTKTSLGVNLAVNLAGAGHAAVLIASAELPRELLMTRICACVSGVKLNDIRSGRILEPKFRARYESWCDWARTKGKAIAVRGARDDLTFGALRDRVSSLQDATGSDKIVAIADGLQTLASRQREAGEAERDALDRCTEELVDSWERAGVTSALLSHMPMAAFKRVGQGVCFGSGRIEYRADLVLVLHAPDEDDRGEKFEVKIRVTKNWHGAIGTVAVPFDSARCRFESR